MIKIDPYCLFAYYKVCNNKVCNKFVYNKHFCYLKFLSVSSFIRETILVKFVKLHLQYYYSQLSSNIYMLFALILVLQTCSAHWMGSGKTKIQGEWPKIKPETASNRIILWGRPFHRRNAQFHLRAAKFLGQSLQGYINLWLLFIPFDNIKLFHK